MPDRFSAIYLAGPMSGYLKLNREMFERKAAYLRGKYACEVFSPLEHDIEEYGEDWIEENDGTNTEACIDKYSFSLGNALADDLNYICRIADCIAMLPGWENSKGARAEHATAVALGLEIIYLSD